MEGDLFWQNYWWSASCLNNPAGYPICDSASCSFLDAVKPWRCQGGSLYKLVFDMQDFVMGDWDGSGSIRFPVVANPELFLRSVYGPGWSEPVVGEQWHQLWSMHNLNARTRDMGKSFINMTQVVCSRRITQTPCCLDCQLLPRQDSCALRRLCIQSWKEKTKMQSVLADACTQTVGSGGS